VSPKAKPVRRFGDERGFSLIQLVVALAVGSIIAGFSIFGIKAARSSTRLGNSARAFAQAAERARLDAIRRRTTTHIEFTDSNKYEITMDFAGNNTSQTRSFTLDDGVVIADTNWATMNANSDSLPYADFDWRGRTAECNMLFNFKNDRSERLTVQIAGSGDISVNSSANVNSNTISYTNVNSTSDVNPSASLTGTDTKCNLSPCGVTAGSTTCATSGGSGGTPPPQQCLTGTLQPSTTYITDLKRNGGNTRTVTITVSGAGQITLTPDSTGNVSVSPSTTQTITSSSGGSVTYTLRSVTRSISTFYIKFSYSNCNVTVAVKVTK
jgi:Tfp pilus assembly protein FimT